MSQSGFDKEEYESISIKKKLPTRCPLALNCGRAKGTRWLFKQKFEPGETGGAFEYCLTEDENYEENPSVHIINNHNYPKEYLVMVWNTCPEDIFERYKVFASYYKDYKDYDMSGKIRVSQEESTGKHYSECHEFSQWFLDNNKKKTKKSSARRTISPMTRFEIFQRDDFKCRYCGATKNKKELVIDHILPVSEGGTDSINNLATACIDCNIGKSNKII